MIELNNICLRIHNQLLINNGNFVVKEGDVVVILGESGSGKTTLLHEISLLSRYSNALYLWDGKRIDLLDDEVKSNIRRLDIGYVMQDLELISDKLTLRDNIQCMCALTNQDYNEEMVKKYIHELNIDISLDDSVEKMSRGERQRFALVLALIKDAKLIICDEPTSALDEGNARDFIEKLKYIAHAYNKMIVIATHDHQVMEHADCIYRIKDNHLTLEKDSSNVVRKSDVAKKRMAVGYTFYRIYKKGYRTVSKNFMNIIYIFLICLLCLSPVVLNHVQEKNKAIYNLLATHEIIVKQDYGNVFGDSSIKLLKDIDHIKDVHLYYELDGYINIDGELTSVKVIPKSDIDHYVVSSSLSKNITRCFDLNIQLNDKLTILPINNYAVLNYPQKKHIDKEIIYVSLPIWNQLLKQEKITNSHMLMIYCDEVENIDNTIKEMKRWFPDVQVTSETMKYLKQIDLLENIGDYVLFLQFIVVFAIATIAYMTIYLENKSRIKEITNLRINGFNKNHFYTLYMYENIYVLLITVLCVIMSYFIINYTYGSHIILMNFIVLCFQIIAYLFITKLIPVFIVVRRIFVKDISVLLRSRL